MVTDVDWYFLAASAPFTKIPPASTTLRPPTISSAPAIPDFVPPEPTSSDPYPGYYQLSSGQWAAYDPDYYHSFFPESSSSSDAQDTFGAQGDKKEDGRVGHHWDEYESKGANVLDIDVNEGLKRAREEQERVEKLKRPKVAGEEYEYKVSVCGPSLFLTIPVLSSHCFPFSIFLSPRPPLCFWLLS